MPTIKKGRKIHKIGDSDMVAIPPDWKRYWIGDDGEDLEEVDIYVNSLVILVPTNAKNYDELTERAREIVEK